MQITGIKKQESRLKPYGSCETSKLTVLQISLQASRLLQDVLLFVDQ